LIVGLRGWDDFIVRNANGQLFTVPTVPLSIKYLANFQLPPEPIQLAADDRFHGRIKWYVTPLAAGGDPQAKENTIWVDHDKHSELVVWWNNRLQTVRRPIDA
jgi:hypothetical protein